MNQKLFYSTYLKDKFLQELRKMGHSIVRVEKDFVGVWSIFYRTF